MSKGTKAVSIFGGIALMVSLAACGSADANDSGSARIDTPKSLVGTWHQTNKLDSGVMMEAEVHRGNTIQINMRTRESRGIYWMGSFESAKNPKFNFNTISQVDPDGKKILDKSLFGSRDTEKEFKYERGDLSFDFTMMGVTSTVHLRKHYKPSASKKPTATVTKTPPAKARPTATKTPNKATSTKK